jgi:uncharacterized protein (DUF924 family)
MISADDQARIDDLLDFWFADETKANWWQASAAFDRLCKERYAGLAADAAAGRLGPWEASAEGALACCLLLDQLPRNLHRGTPDAFATDPAAVAVADRAVQAGHDRALPPDRRAFLYMPFMHSERLEHQEQGIALFKALADEKSVEFAEEHAEVIRRFGRFPHRNRILGRETTDAEAAFLADGAKHYGQKAPAED